MNSKEFAPVQIKADRDGFSLVPDPSMPFDEILAFMRHRLGESRDFFHRSEMVLDVRGKPLQTDQILALYELLSGAGVVLREVRLSDGVSLSFGKSVARTVPPPSSSAQVSSAPVVYRNTCRSGHRVVSGSDCVVLGDINPGAEVIAIGDVIVFGSLRGLAHAGAGGDRKARIWALSIEPPQIRIADLAASVDPRGSKSSLKRFEIAEVQGDSIEIVTI